MECAFCKFDGVKWLFFDVGSTLVDEHIAYEYRMREIAELAHTTYEKVYRSALDLYKQNKKGDLETAKALGVELPKWHTEAEILYDDTLKSLACLWKKYKIGIIANQPMGMKERLKQHGILQYIDLVIASAEEDVAKPDKKIFEIALERSNCKVGQYWNIAEEAERADYTVNSLTEICNLLIGGRA